MGLKINEIALNQAAAALAQGLRHGGQMRQRKMIQDYTNQQLLQQKALEAQAEELMMKQRLAAQIELERYRQSQIWMRQKDEQKWRDRNREDQKKFKEKIETLPKPMKPNDLSKEAFRLMEEGRKLMEMGQGSSMLGISGDPTIYNKGMQMFIEGRRMYDMLLKKKVGQKEYKEIKKGQIAVENLNKAVGMMIDRLSKSQAQTKSKQTANNNKKEEFETVPLNNLGYRNPTFWKRNIGKY